MSGGRNPDQTASRRALRLSLHPDAGVLAAWAAAHAEQVDWHWVERRARAHKVVALLAARLDAAGLAERLDDDLRRRLAAARSDAVQRAQAAERTLATLAAAGDAAGLPFFVVKGSVLAHRIYGDPGLRRFADVDVVVRRADVARAEEVLRALGYRPGGIASILAAGDVEAGERARALALTRRFEARQLAAFTWYAPADGGLLAVDLHWEVSPWRLHVDEAALWEQTVPVQIGDLALRTLTPPATLLHLAAHATTSLFNGFRLLHLCDVAWAARHLAAHDAETWHLARRWRVGAHLGLVCETVERVLGVELSLAAGAPRPRRPRPLVDRVASDEFLLAATEQAERPFAARLCAELAWSVAMGCLRRNATVVAAVSWARLRFRLSRWRRHP